MNNEKKYRQLVFHRCSVVASLVAIALLNAACASTTPAARAAPAVPAAMAAPVMHSVTVYFDDTGCPVYTAYNNLTNGMPVVEADKDFVIWEAEPKTRTGANPGDNEFEVIFDPFQGPPIKSTNGTTPPSKTKKASDLPLTNYKYTVWNKADCPNNPLDPNIRVW